MVRPMTSCRATSFYVAPGVQHYFGTSTLVTYYQGQWHEFLHRRDLENFQSTHPDWDQLCYVSHAVGDDGIEIIRAAIKNRPEEVEIWRIDSRVVNGRSPGGPASALFALAHRGLGGAGGLTQLTDRLFADANKPLRNATASVAHLPGSHLALAISSALRPAIGDDQAASLLANASIVAAALNYQPVDPSLLTDVYEKLIKHYSPPRASSLLSELTTLSGLNESGRWALAAHTTDTQLLTLLSQDTSYRVRSEVASHVSTPPDILDILAQDTDEYVQQRVAENPSTSAETLIRMSALPEEGIRKSVAANPATPPETVATLAADEYWIVCAAAARNPHCPQETMALLRSEDWNMLNELAANPAYPPEEIALLAACDDYAVHVTALKNPSCPIDVLREAAISSNWAERREVALNPACPVGAIDVLGLLAADEDWDVREAVASHPNCPPELLRVLCCDDDSGLGLTRQAALANPNCPADALIEASTSEDPHVRREIARNPNCPLSVMYSMADDSAPTVTGALANNPACPPELRATILAKDPDPDAQALAAMISATYRLPPVVPHPGVTYLQEVAIIAQRDTEFSGVIWPARPKSFFELPARAALPWDISPTTNALIGRKIRNDGKVLTLRRLESKHALDQNANYMGNCTAGYAKSISRGDAVILALDDESGKPVYNVELRRGTGTVRAPLGQVLDHTKPWYLGQVNSRFNDGIVPPWVNRQLEILVDGLIQNIERETAAAPAS